MFHYIVQFSKYFYKHSYCDHKNLLIIFQRRIFFYIKVVPHFYVTRIGENFAIAKTFLTRFFWSFSQGCGLKFDYLVLVVVRCHSVLGLVASYWCPDFWWVLIAKQHSLVFSRTILVAELSFSFKSQ